MLVIECYGKNIYVGTDLVGYIDKFGNIFMNGRRFAKLTDDGKIIIEEVHEAGYIDDIGDIYLNGKNCGHIMESNDLYFSPKLID